MYVSPCVCVCVCALVCVCVCLRALCLSCSHCCSAVREHAESQTQLDREVRKEVGEWIALSKIVLVSWWVSPCLSQERPLILCVWRHSGWRVQEEQARVNLGLGFS